MALQSFRISGVKAVSLAECTAVPSVMVVAGPNGVGKSTVLYQLSLQAGAVFDHETRVLYQPPHRAIRATVVRRRFTFGGATRWFSDLLSLREVSGFEGMNFPQPGRTPDNVDEAGSTIKHSLGRLENRYQLALAQRVQRDKKEGLVPHLDYAAIPDIYEPLRTFTKFLLPHLAFESIDVSDEENVKCLWKRHDLGGHIILDIDQLSSGEKAMITLFLPLLETEISALLNQIDPVQGPAGGSDMLMIIDEPEQHIHPDLQARVMTYLRGIATTTTTQFIVSTHSPTILDQAWDDELYVMTPRGTDVNENQLKKVATNLERLEALRQLTGGNTFVVTTGRSIVCLEGRHEIDSQPTDVRLLELMFPRSTSYTFVPVGNKANVITTVTELRQRLPKDIFKIDVFGITDTDRGAPPTPGVFSWPMCMIENVLVRPGLLVEASRELQADPPWPEERVAELLARLVAERRSDEIGLRVSRRLGGRTIRVKGDTLDGVIAQLDAQLRPLQKLRDDRARLEQAVTEATAEVDRIIEEGKATTVFRGKALLHAVYNTVFPTGRVSYAQFVHALAVHAAADLDIQTMLNELFDRLR